MAETIPEDSQKEATTTSSAPPTDTPAQEAPEEAEIPSKPTSHAADAEPETSKQPAPKSSSRLGSNKAKEGQNALFKDNHYVAPTRDSRNITFQTRILNPHLVCTLCMGYFTEACTIIECLHTFCKACIYHYFKDAKDCPTCGENLGTNPVELVRADRTLQSLVDKIFPHFVQRELSRAEEAKLKDNTVQPPAPAPAPRHSSTGASKPQKRPPPESTAPPAKSRKAEAAAADRGEEDMEEISFSLQEALDPSAPAEAMEQGSLAKLEKPYLRTSARLTVAHLKKYLVKKMGLNRLTQVEIMCKSEVLALDLSLEQIWKTRWQDGTTDLVLHYRQAQDSG